MSIEALKHRLPDYAKDLKLNLGSLAAEPSLSAQQRAGTFVASALACAQRRGDAGRRRRIRAAALSAEALTAAKAAAAIMAMNNVYYRFTHLVGGDYANMPAKLRMNVIGRPGVEKVDFELWSLAVSAVNGCGMCMEATRKSCARRADPGAGAGGGAHRRGGACGRRDARRRGCPGRAGRLTHPPPRQGGAVGCCLITIPSLWRKATELGESVG